MLVGRTGCRESLGSEERRLARGHRLGVAAVKGYPHPGDHSSGRPGAMTGWERDVLNPALGSPSLVNVSDKQGLCKVSDWGWRQ